MLDAAEAAKQAGGMVAKAAEVREARSSIRGLRSRMNRICERTLAGRQATARSADARVKNSLRSRGSDATKVNSDVAKADRGERAEEGRDAVQDDDGRYGSEGW
jgi:hypothetical protein